MRSASPSGIFLETMVDHHAVFTSSDEDEAISFSASAPQRPLRDAASGTTVGADRRGASAERDLPGILNVRIKCRSVGYQRPANMGRHRFAGEVGVTPKPATMTRRCPAHRNLVQGAVPPTLSCWRHFGHVQGRHGAYETDADAGQRRVDQVL